MAKLVSDNHIGRRCSLIIAIEIMVLVFLLAGVCVGSEDGNGERIDIFADGAHCADIGG